MRRSSFAQAAIDEGAAALNRVFKDYLVPIAFSAEQLHLHMSYNDVDPSLSPIWFDDAGAVLAAALLAIRGARGWIGGFGVAPEYRRRGYASALIDDIIGSARERDLQTLTLEVLCDNVPAVALYRNAGFQVTRRLLSFETLTEDALMPDGFGYVSARELIDEAEAVRPCWQREPASLRNGAGSSGVSDGNGTYALFRYNDSLAQVLKAQAQHARKFAALAVALSAGRQFRSVMLLNEPEESPLVGFAQEAGWNEPFLQYEMQMHL